MKPGRSLAERSAERERIRQSMLERARHVGLTWRCDHVLENLDDPEHRLCRGELPGNSGCLCFCHDLARAAQS